MPAEIQVPAGLHGAAAEYWRQAEIRRRQAEAHLEEFRALARVAAAPATKVTGLPTPDAVRTVASREDALKVLRLAGHNVEAIAGNWSASEPRVQQQVSSPVAGDGLPLELDPDHDPRVIAAITDPRASMRDVAQVRQQVAVEYAEAAARRARQRAQADDVLWETREGVAVRSGHNLPWGIQAGPGGAPARKSISRPGVAELGSEPVPAALVQRDAVLGRQQASPPSCAHPQAEAGHLWCGDCGSRIGQAAT